MAMPMTIREYLRACDIDYQELPHPRAGINIINQHINFAPFACIAFFSPQNENILEDAVQCKRHTDYI